MAARELKAATSVAGHKDGQQGLTPAPILATWSYRSIASGETIADCEVGFPETAFYLARFAAIVGAAPDNETAVKIIRELQKGSILALLIGNHEGRTIRDQLLEEGGITEDPKAGWDIHHRE